VTPLPNPAPGAAETADSFAAFFAHRRDTERTFLVALDHDAGTRVSWTVGQWRDRVLATVDWLAGCGLRPGDCVAALAGNTADALAVAYGCWVFGACYVPLNPADSADRQAYILKDARAALLVAGPAFRARAEEVGRAAGVPLADTTALPAAGPARDSQMSTVDAGRGHAVATGAVTLDAAALRVYTSGTTGEPKGVVLSAANLLADCAALAAGLRWEPSTRVITVLPVHHVNGLVISSLLPWYCGLSTVLCDRFRSERFWADIKAEGATVSSMVPTLLEFLLATPEGPDGPGLREVLCGAGPLLVETVLDFERRFELPVRHLYGLSETTAVATLMPRLPDAERRRWHRDYGFPSIGPALPGIRVQIVNGDHRFLPAGVRGEIAIQGPTVMRGYAGLPSATTEAMRYGWFHSGDEGFWQDGPDGTPYFFITGRLKELIIRGGANISPFEVDEVLRSHPAVRYGLAIPFENRLYGEEIAAYVVAAREVTETEILAHCARYLDYSRCPKVVVFGNDVPYTATGKAKRLELKARLAQQLAQYRDTQFRRPRDGG
jgi:long-chain acyl-CoA synthetase